MWDPTTIVARYATDWVAMPLTTSADTAHETLPSPVIAPPMPAVTDSKVDARSAATDFLQIESIVLNLDASLRVHARAHFFSWTQGLLQSLIRHELLICTLCHGKPPAFRADGFSMTSPDPALFSDMFLRDNSVAPALLKTWEERRFQPVVLDAASSGSGAVSGGIPAGIPMAGGGAFWREIERIGATQLLSHG